MKLSFYLFAFLLAVSVFFQSCTEEYPGYSDNLLSILDTLGNAANEPKDITAPCTIEKNHIDYIGYSNYYDFEYTTCGTSATSFLGHYYFEAGVYYFADLKIYFAYKPYEGIYTTTEDVFSQDSSVYIYYHDGDFDFQVTVGQDVYVEIESDGSTSITFCELNTTSPIGDFVLEGNLSCE